MGRLVIEETSVYEIDDCLLYTSWAGSSWYFLRYVDNHNDEELVSREKADKYLPVDMYIGGVEHAVLHLLYSRFYTKFLHDIGAVSYTHLDVQALYIQALQSEEQRRRG